jgi:hypothetical protein
VEKHISNEEKVFFQYFLQNIATPRAKILVQKVEIYFFTVLIL